MQTGFFGTFLRKPVLASISLLFLGIYSSCTPILNTPPAGDAKPAVVTSDTTSQLSFGQQPTSALVGTSLSPAVVVKVTDGNGNVDTTFAGTITLALGKNPGNGTLSGPVSVAAVKGLATFNSLSIDKPASGYTLVVSSGTLTANASSSFDITPPQSNSNLTATPTPGGSTSPSQTSTPSPSPSLSPAHNSSLGISASVSSQTQSTAYSYTVTAYKDGVIDTNYLGTVSLTSNDPFATLPLPHKYSSSDGGVYIFTGYIPASLGLQVVTASDGSLSKSESGVKVTTACSLSSQAFTYTGANQTYVVPTGCTSILAKLWGAGGGGSTNTTPSPWPGGAGGFVAGALSVSAGQSYTVIVGQGGGAPGSSAFGGGGIGYDGGYRSGGGGGRSALRLAASELLTAGAGGGGSAAEYGVDQTGGAGGGLSGHPSGSAAGGEGGSQTAGGVPSSGGGLAVGGNGSAYTGGNGDGSRSAGGGAGYYGGSGGTTGNWEAGAGGGGSSYYSGANVTAGTTAAGRYATAGNSLDSDRSGAGDGGVLGSGANGKVVLYGSGMVPFSVSPTSGVVSGNSLLSVSGFNMEVGTTIKVGGNPCVNVTYSSATQLKCTLPSGSAGAADVEITSRVTGKVTTLSGAYTYFACNASNCMPFYATGAPQAFTVPTGVTSLTVKLWGAGGGGGGANGSPTVGYAGGAGGYSTGNISVTPGQTYTLLVGGGGVSGGGRLLKNGYGGGGGNLNYPIPGGVSSAFVSGQGGGRSAIQLSGTELITAGGGGGGSASRVQAPTGGAGGGTNGSQGGSTVSGNGGTQSAGGTVNVGTSGNGLPGSAFQGAHPSFTRGGGGGGGGYFGGASGSVSSWDCGAGGGGSGYIGGTGVSSASMTAGAGTTPGNSADTDLPSGMALGGPVGSAGGDGFVLVTW